MKVIVKTQSNYRNTNGKLLEVKEIVGDRVSCFVETPEFGKIVVDFKQKEIVEIRGKVFYK